MQEDKSVTIINRSNQSVTGENTNALPVKLVANIKFLKILILGIVSVLLVAFLIIFLISRSVVQAPIQ